jgi:hypothetical protein
MKKVTSAGKQHPTVSEGTINAIDCEPTRLLMTRHFEVHCTYRQREYSGVLSDTESSFRTVNVTRFAPITGTVSKDSMTIVHSVFSDSLQMRLRARIARGPGVRTRLEEVIRSPS